MMKALLHVLMNCCQPLFRRHPLADSGLICDNKQPQALSNEPSNRLPRTSQHDALIDGFNIVAIGRIGIEHAVTIEEHSIVSWLCHSPLHGRHWLALLSHVGQCSALPISQ